MRVPDWTDDMEITYSSALAGLIGGLLIGTSAALLLLLNGRIAGISGIVGGLLRRGTDDLSWRAAFAAGLVAGGALLLAVYPEAVADAMVAPTAQLAVAGLLVGFGTRLGSGCTSGHGVCGLARFSKRSMLAVPTFIGAGVLAVALLRALGRMP